jgi:hypothetical protein
MKNRSVNVNFYTSRPRIQWRSRPFARVTPRVLVRDRSTDRAASISWRSVATGEKPDARKPRGGGHPAVTNHFEGPPPAKSRSFTSFRMIARQEGPDPGENGRLAGKAPRAVGAARRLFVRGEARTAKGRCFAAGDCWKWGEKRDFIARTARRENRCSSLRSLGVTTKG